VHCRAPDDAAIRRELLAARKDIRDGQKATGALFRNLLASKDVQDAPSGAGNPAAKVDEDGSQLPGGEGSGQTGLVAAFVRGMGVERGNRWLSAAWSWWVSFWFALLGLPQAQTQVKPAASAHAEAPLASPSRSGPSSKKDH
jgi:hypothetical protein